MPIQRAMIPLALAAASFMVTTLAATTAVQSVKPIQYQGINLGAVAGDLYYTVKADGYHVVATFAPRGQQAAPVRFQAVLAAGQSVTFSATVTAPYAVVP